MIEGAQSDIFARVLGSTLCHFTQDVQTVHRALIGATA